MAPQAAGAASRPGGVARWQLDGLLPLREAAEDWLRGEAKTHPIIRKLSTAPGMGIIRTAQTVAIVANPERFRTRRQFWSYSGLSIVTRSSADWVRDRSGRLVRSQVQQTRGLTRKRNALLKSVFKGAATTVIALLPDDPLRMAYERALARRIAATVLSMWKNQEVYDPERHRPLTETPALS